MIRGKREKGQYGYRNFRRRAETAKVLFGAAMILAQLFARNFTDNQAAKNILTVMAILSVLPAANVAAPLLASWKYRTPSREFYERMTALEEKGCMLYDLIITSREQIIPADAVMVHPMGIFVCCVEKKVDARKGEAFLNDTLKSHKLSKSARIIKDEKTFLKKMESLKPAGGPGEGESLVPEIKVLKGLSM